MPRINRKDYISSFLHIMVQGINKEDIFKEDFYKELYIGLIDENIKQFDLNNSGYAIMDNHAHLLLNYLKIENVSKFMHKINQRFAQIYNMKEKRVGYVFRGRYRCEQIKDEAHLYNVLAYIHFNPVKANKVKYLIDYKFSSYSKYINGNIEKEIPYMIFKTYDYKTIFINLHKVYFEKYVKNYKKIKDYKDVIKEFKSKNKIVTTELIVKEKNLLFQLILELENSTNLNDKQISKILNIGKNRIRTLKSKI